MQVQRVAVLGAGAMGSQIAQVLAQSGLQVAMQDVDGAIVQRAMNAIQKSLQRFFVEKGKLTAEQAQEILGRIHGTADRAAAVKEADVVIESIPENLALKLQVIKEVSGLVREDTILASNTSALSISAIASAVQGPERVIGMHFFNPVAVMRLVEIVRGMRTSDETVEVIKGLSARLGKETVVIKDTPGFIASRMVDVIINEAACMLQEGIASAEDIDKAIKLGLGHPMGPLELADYTGGISIVLEGMEYMQHEFGDAKYRPAYLLRQMVRAGRLGKKAGKGFYNY